MRAAYWNSRRSSVATECYCAANLLAARILAGLISLFPPMKLVKISETGVE